MIYSNAKTAGIIFFIGTTQLIFGLIIAEAYYPGYNISQNYISDLGIGPSAIIFNLSIFLLGLFIFLGTYFLYKFLNNKVFTVMLIFIGLGCVGVGIFTDDVQPIHSIAAIIIFLFGGFAAIFSYKLLKIRFKLINIILGIIALSALVLFITNQYLWLGPGGMERMIVFPILIWTYIVSYYLISQPEKLFNY
jgi:hypothetical membrane protein